MVFPQGGVGGQFFLGGGGRRSGVGRIKMLEAGAVMLPILSFLNLECVYAMAKQPIKTNPSPRDVRAGRAAPMSSGLGAAADEGPVGAEEGFGGAMTELELMEAALSEMTGGDARVVARAPQSVEVPQSVEDMLGRSGAGAAISKGGGSAERAALAGFAAVVLLAGGLFLKFLYAHPAPIHEDLISTEFPSPLAGEVVKLSGAELGWRDRVDSDKAQAEEVVVPTALLVLDEGASSTGFLRVEFIDPEGKIRGDILTVGIEGGRFKDGGRGEVIEEGGRRLRLVGTVGYRSQALFSSYLVGEEPRWSVRLKEGADYSKGPWSQFGAALIPSKKTL